MNLKSTSRTIMGYVLLFPPVVLLLYAVISYFMFLNFQQNISNSILSIQQNAVAKISKETIITKAKTLNRVINRENSLKHVLQDIKDMQNVNSSNHVDIVLLDSKNRLLFPKKFKDVNILKSLKIVQNNTFYEDKNVIAYMSNSNKYKIKIISFFNKVATQKELNYLKNNLAQEAKSSIKNSLIVLFSIWSVLVALSLVITLFIHRKLKEYKEALANSHNSIIFQSRKAMLGDLLPMIAHQWRQPINKIASVLMKMRFEIAKGEPNPTELDRQCQTIENSVELMSNTIDDFRSFYRPKDNPEPTDLSIVIRKAVYFLDELLDKKKVNIQQNLASVYLNIHANEFLQVVINLIKNATDAIEAGGSISISLKDLGNLVELRFEDTGTGIPEDKLQKIFEPHESSKQGSMGLGLYMSKIIIEDHFKGTITAYNTQFGAGFLIRLPK